MDWLEEALIRGHWGWHDREISKTNTKGSSTRTSKILVEMRTGIRLTRNLVNRRKQDGISNVGFRLNNPGNTGQLVL